MLTVDPDDDLHTALRGSRRKTSTTFRSSTPNDKSHILGMLSRRDVIAAYHDKVTELQQVDAELMERPV